MRLIDKLLKKQEKLEIEVVEQHIDGRRQELATVQVRDIKQYLLEEYERSQQLYNQNEQLKKKLLETEEVKNKYDATLVTLDEYKSRLDSYEKKFLSYEKDIENAKEETKQIRDELNDYKIRFQRASITKDDIKIEVIQETKEKIVNAIMKHRGNLSKTKAVDIIRGVE